MDGCYWQFLACSQISFKFPDSTTHRSRNKKNEQPKHCHLAVANILRETIQLAKAGRGRKLLHFLYERANTSTRSHFQVQFLNIPNLFKELCNIQRQPIHTY